MRLTRVEESRVCGCDFFVSLVRNGSRRHCGAKVLPPHPTSFSFIPMRVVWKYNHFDRGNRKPKVLGLARAATSVYAYMRAFMFHAL